MEQHQNPVAWSMLSQSTVCLPLIPANALQPPSNGAKFSGVEYYCTRQASSPLSQSSPSVNLLPLRGASVAASRASH